MDTDKNGVQLDQVIYFSGPKICTIKKQTLDGTVELKTLIVLCSH